MKQRTNLTLHPAIRVKAARLMESLHHSDLSGLVEQLIRDEWERRNGPLMLLQEQFEKLPEVPPGKKTRYPPIKKSAKDKP